MRLATVITASVFSILGAVAIASWWAHGGLDLEIDSAETLSGFFGDLMLS
jgi:hypothetical protein